MGSLKLRFQSFEYSIYQNNQWSDWTPGWAPPTKVDIQWRVEITNISNETIILNNLSYLILSSCDGPTETCWYIKDSPLTLSPDSTTPIIYRFAEPTKDNKFAQVPNSETQIVYLTFFGTSESPTGSSPFGQTIPFLSTIAGGA